MYLTSVLNEMINPMAKDELIVSVLGVRNTNLSYYR